MNAVTTEKACLWRLEDLGVELWRRREVTGSAKHSHDEWQVGRSVLGHGRWWLRHASLDAAPSTVVVVPPGEVHASGSPDGSSWLLESIYIPDELFARIAAEMVDSGEGAADPSRVLLTDQRTSGWFAAFWNVHTGHATRLERGSALNGLVACLSGQGIGSLCTSASIGVEPVAVKRAREFLHAFATREVPLQELAEVSGLGPFRLNRAFRRIVGVPPHAYQIQLRVRRAEALLASGLAIADVAEMAGFFDQSHLGRHFKHLVGMSPGEYRRIARTS